MSISLETQVVNLYKEVYDVYIGRPGRGRIGYFGNPVRRNQPCPVCTEVHRSAGDTLPCYEAYLRERLKTDSVFREQFEQLKGKILGCFCKPRPCHGDVIKRLLEEGDY